MTAKDFILGLPAKVNKDALEGMETVFHFDISGDDGGQYTVAVADGDIQVQEGLAGEAKCVVKGTDENLIGVISGKINPMMALMTGKIKITNQGEMLKYARLFGLM
jgi:putative sterol carrier protein